MCAADQAAYSDLGGGTRTMALDAYDGDAEMGLEVRRARMRSPSVVRHERMISLQRVPSYTHVFDSTPHSDPIEELGVIGNLRTVALLSCKGNICWFCYPGHFRTCPPREIVTANTDFDSPALFGSLLGDESTGFYRISVGIPLGESNDVKENDPDPHSLQTKQMYHPDTNILVYVFVISLLSLPNCLTGTATCHRRVWGKCLTTFPFVPGSLNGFNIKEFWSGNSGYPFSHLSLVGSTHRVRCRSFVGRYTFVLNVVRRSTTAVQHTRSSL
jgi:hypothetical protein